MRRPLALATVVLPLLIATGPAAAQEVCGNLADDDSCPDTAGKLPRDPRPAPLEVAQ